LKRLLSAMSGLVPATVPNDTNGSTLPLAADDDQS
jgi:hypothetical protein